MSLERNRTILINVEGSQWSGIHKLWNTLALPSIGRVAENEGFEVILWDELHQGPMPEQLIEPGDVIGLSVLTTGIERSVKLARMAKSRKAKTVIAGNDAAMFRARQLLSLAEKPEENPIDAVFTSNSLRAIQQFYIQIKIVAPKFMKIPNMITDRTLAPLIANEAGIAKTRTLKATDYFITPNLGLHDNNYWESVWENYRSNYGHKYQKADQLRNATILLAQGCPRAAAGEVCRYCAIGEVANVFLPITRYLEETLDAYSRFGINTFFNVTDSSFEMGKLIDDLTTIGAKFDRLVLYGRAQALGNRKDLFDRWLNLVGERLQINSGFDAGDENILKLGVNKAASQKGSRLVENYDALKNVKEAGSQVHLHMSEIFGSPGESRDSCRRSLDLLGDAIGILGDLLDVAECEIWWLTFGSECANIFRSHAYAEKLAAMAGKEISADVWWQDFGRHANELAVPWSCQEAWYRHFTNISLGEAREFAEEARKMMRQLPNRIPDRQNSFSTTTGL